MVSTLDPFNTFVGNLQLLSLSIVLSIILLSGVKKFITYVSLNVFFITGELHLTPLHGALQLRPSFEYLNKGEANARQNASLTEEGIAIASS